MIVLHLAALLENISNRLRITEVQWKTQSNLNAKFNVSFQYIEVGMLHVKRYVRYLP